MGKNDIETAASSASARQVGVGVCVSVCVCLRVCGCMPVSDIKANWRQGV